MIEHCWAGPGVGAVYTMYCTVPHAQGAAAVTFHIHNPNTLLVLYGRAAVGLGDSSLEQHQCSAGGRGQGMGQGSIESLARVEALDTCPFHISRSARSEFHSPLTVYDAVIIYITQR